MSPPMLSSAPSAAPDTVVEVTRWLAVSSLLALMLLCVGWELWWAPVRPGGSWLALKALPLCIPLAGLLRRRLYTYRWVSLLLWIYFIEGTVRASSERGLSASLAMLEVGLCLVLFIACAVHVRRRLARGTPERPLGSGDRP